MWGPDPYDRRVRAPEVIEGDGVRLRRWRPEDVSVLAAVRSDPSVTRWSGLATEDGPAWIARQAAREDDVSLAVTDAADPAQRCLGKLALGNHEPAARRA